METLTMAANQEKKVSAVNWSGRKKVFSSSANWTRSDWDREWTAWIDDVQSLLNAAGRTTEPLFSTDEQRILNVIHATARAERLANNMIGLRDALSRYRAAVKHFLGTNSQQPAAGERKSA